MKKKDKQKLISQILVWKNVFLILIVAIYQIGIVGVQADTLDSSKKNILDQKKYNFDLGFEGSELYYSDRPISTDNYTFLVGQRFTTEKFNNFGWRFVAINSHLNDNHIDSLFWTHGNTDNVNAILTVKKFNLDYYTPKTFKTKHFEIIPVFSIVGGYRNSQFSTKRTTLSLIQELGPEQYLIYREIVDKNPQLANLYAHNVDPNYTEYTLSRPYSSPWTEQKGIKTSSLGLAARLKFLFYSLVFVEIYIDATYETPRAHSFWLGDFHGTPPSRMGSFGWTNIGFQLAW